MKRIIYLVLLLFVLFCFSVISGQEITHRNLTIKFPVSVLVGDITAESMGVGLGIEKIVEDNLSISQEISYIFHVKNKSILSKDLESINGIKLSTELRKYLNIKEKPVSGWFFSVDFKNILTKSVQKISTYESVIVDNNIFRYRGVVNANMGVLFYWDKDKESRITFELLWGIGVGYLYSQSSIDVKALRVESNYNNYKGFYPNVNFDIKIGFVLK